MSKSVKNIGFTQLNQQAEFLERFGKGLQSLSGSSISFKASLADLSIQSGITGEALNVISDHARQLGVSTGMGAEQALQAYRVLASEVDVSKVGLEGLNILQTKTMTLAKASGMEVGNAAMALSGTVSRFGLAAEEAGRVMNVLAAGAKYGKAGIPELAQALRVVGETAQSAGVDVETAAGALEVLSRGQLKGTEAGQALSAVVSGMQSSLGIDFNTTSFSAALDALKPRLGDTAYLSQVFGENNVAAARYLIGHASAVQEMTAKVTDSNVAQQQADLRGQTMASRMAVIRQRVDGLKYSLFEMTGGFTGYLSLAGEFAAGAANYIPLLALMSKGFKALRMQKLLDKSATEGLTLALSRQVIVQKLSALWQGIVKGATLVWTAAQWLLNVALNANPIGLIILAITALIGGITLVVNKFSSWGAAFLTFMGPVGWLIDAIILLKKNWASVTEAFKTEGILGGLKRIGTVLLDVLLYPLQQILTLIGKIPGFSFAKRGAEKLQGLRDSMNLVTPGKEDTAGETAEEEKTESTPGISAVTLPGTDNASIVPTYQTTSPAVARQSSQVAVGGGSRSAGVTVHLGKLMDHVNIYAQEFRDGLNDLDNKVLECLTRVLNRAQSNGL